MRSGEASKFIVLFLEVHLWMVGMAFLASGASGVANWIAFSGALLLTILRMGALLWNSQQRATTEEEEDQETPDGAGSGSTSARSSTSE